ncbi:site-specific integrase [Candidatus Nanohalobium constans]|uniref:Phage integrase family n=1 Tax=Candidatus Nanohalobium constans TaxID=2565781 RepID=A0A5Q0UI60_9ARCH|nr:site-specific integrase [Candidatus Nanohalobium constans]QGA80870.1 phage integrase family [Candidatus Nanohalobium constans]
MTKNTTSDSNSKETSFEVLHRVNSELAKNPEISDHNKQILEDFFDEWIDRVESSTIDDYSSQWNRIAEEIDFNLDEAEREDVKEIIKKLGRDEIKKRNGETYSDYSKDKTKKALTVFYRSFVEYTGEGEEEYLEELNGSALVRKLDKYLNEPQKEVIPETKPDPSQMKKIIESADSFRNRCIIFFGWATGCRIGEIFPTDDKPQPLLWKDINFKSNDDKMTVRLRVNKKGGSSSRRVINMVNSRPVMKKLYEEQNPDPDEPVFKEKDADIRCPDCRANATRVAKNSDKSMSTSSRRKYACDECSWRGKSSSAYRKKEALGAGAVRDIVKEAVNDSEVRNIDDNPHAVFRKARALHKQAMNWGDGGIRSFFGWAENSSSPGHYKEALEVNQKQDLQNEHPELDINVEGRFYDESLKPTKCSECEKLNSRLWDICNRCGKELTYDGMVMTGDTPDSTKNEIKHEVKDWGIDYLLDKSSIEEEDFKSELMDVLDNKLQEVDFDSQDLEDGDEEGIEDLDKEDIVEKMQKLQNKVEELEG